MRICVLWLVALTAASGCGLHQRWRGAQAPNGVPQAALAQNPMYVPLSDREVLWTQVVDVVDDYFQIEREERVRLVGGVLTEGQIETFPLPGATYLEPWRRDSSPGFERSYASLQSIRRKATVHVRPQTDGGYLVDITVYKELEDLVQPEYSTVNVSGLRHDGTLVRPQERGYLGPSTLGWIPVGRDMSLEQRMLTELRERVGAIAQTP